MVVGIYQEENDLTSSIIKQKKAAEKNNCYTPLTV